MATTVVIPNPLPVSGVATKSLEVVGGGVSSTPSFSTTSSQYAIMTIYSNVNTATITINSTNFAIQQNGNTVLYVPPSSTVSGAANLSGVSYVIFQNA